MDDVNKKFEEFIKAIQDTEWKNKIRTIPEVFGIQYKEVYITKWLAYLLRQKEFGWVILNALLQIGGTDTQVEENDIEKVYTEYLFHSGRRIDILIETKDCLIGIENKIWSGEQENQTSDYENSLKELSSGKKHIGIYLHPEQNKSESDRFQNVTYNELLDELRKLDLFDYPISYEKMMFEQFMIYVKECLYMSKEYPKITDNAKLYAGNTELIQRIDSEYRMITADVIEWLKDRFENNGYAVLNNPRDDKEKYIQLAPKDCVDKWAQINFHFEILWENSLLIPGEFKIEVHLENYKGIDKKLQDLFELKNSIERGDKNPLESAEPISYSFEKEDTANKTFDDILRVLKSDSFQNRAKAADKWG